MALIQTSAWGKLGYGGGPEGPTEIGLLLGERPWAGGGSVPILKFFFGQDEVQVWPADAFEVRKLAEKITKIADQLESEEKQAELLRKKY